MKFTIEIDEKSIKKLFENIQLALFYIVLIFVCFLPVYFAVQEPIEIILAILSLATIYTFFTIWDEYNKMKEKLKDAELQLNIKKKQKKR